MTTTEMIKMDNTTQENIQRQELHKIYSSVSYSKGRTYMRGAWSDLTLLDDNTYDRYFEYFDEKEIVELKFAEDNYRVISLGFIPVSKFREISELKYSNAKKWSQKNAIFLPELSSEEEKEIKEILLQNNNNISKTQNLWKIKTNRTISLPTIMGLR